MFTVDTSAPIMITGATGYVAGWIVKNLLDAGATVHAAVRNPDNADKLKYLNALAEASPGTIKFFKGDLLDEGSYADAMQGCKYVFHTASPFTIDVEDAQKELIDPAKLGTRNVLEEANRTPSVERVVVTSSCAAIYTDNADCADAPGGILTEDIWNTTSSVDYQAYSYSKTVAEQEAWKIANAQDRWKLVTINPSLVIGPGVNPHGTSESISIIRQFGDGSMKSGAPRWGFGLVDVRDLAYAHLAAAFVPEAEGRHIVHADSSDFFGMGQLLADKYGKDYPLPKSAVPKWLFWIIGPFVNRTMKRPIISRNVDIEFKADHSKSIKALGVSYRPIKESLEDMFQQQIDEGVFKKA